MMVPGSDVDTARLNALLVRRLTNLHRTFAVEPTRKGGGKSFRHMLGHERRGTIRRHVHEERLQSFDAAGGGAYHQYLSGLPIERLALRQAGLGLRRTN